MRKSLMSFSILISFGACAANAQNLPHNYSGQYVCKKLPTTRNMLHVPVDLFVDGNNVRFVRPLLNIEGNIVVGQEVATGVIGVDGEVNLSSEWNYLGNVANAQYKGKLTPAGGALSGTQTWSGSGVAPVVRPCSIALVPSEDSGHKSAPFNKD